MLEKRGQYNWKADQEVKWCNLGDFIPLSEHEIN